MSQHVIALDQGTTSSRTIIFDVNGKVVSLSQHPFAQIYPQPGWVEHDPMTILYTQLESLSEAFRTSGLSAADIAAVGITNQRETTIVWEKETGRPVYNAIVWQCRRTAPLCEELRADGWEEKIREKTGLLIDAYFSGTKLRWILDNVPGARERAERGELLFGTVDTWLIWNLTGGRVHVTDYSNASRTMLFNIHTLQWDAELCEALRIPMCMLPKPVSNSEEYGTIDSHMPGLEELSGTPICGAAGDQNPLDLVRISKDNKRELIVWNAQETEVDRSFDMLRECQQIGGRICDAVLRGYRQARNEIQTRPVFRTNCFEMDVPLRTVEKADVDAAGARIEAVKAACPAGGRLTEAQMIRCFEDIGYLNRWKLQQETTRFTFPIFVFRIGAAAFATNPFELYVDYSYRMKARCKARQAFIIQLSSNAKGGYLPTQIAVDGGSYGSKPVSTMVGPEGGDELVEKTIAAMDALF